MKWRFLTAVACQLAVVIGIHLPSKADAQVRLVNPMEVAPRPNETHFMGTVDPTDSFYTYEVPDTAGNRHLYVIRLIGTVWHRVSLDRYVITWRRMQDRYVSEDATVSACQFVWVPCLDPSLQASQGLFNCKYGDNGKVYSTKIQRQGDLRAKKTVGVKAESVTVLDSLSGSVSRTEVSGESWDYSSRTTIHEASIAHTPWVLAAGRQVIVSDGLSLINCRAITRPSDPDVADVQPKLDPNHDRVVFCRSHIREGGDIWIVEHVSSPDSVRERPLVVSHDHSETSPEWSPDGSRIAFYSMKNDSGNAEMADLYVMNVDRPDSPTKLAGNVLRSHTQLNCGPAWVGPRWIVFSSITDTCRGKLQCVAVDSVAAPAIIADYLLVTDIVVDNPSRPRRIVFSTWGMESDTSGSGNKIISAEIEGGISTR